MVQESPAIIAQADELRAFLKSVGLKVTLYWVRHPRNRRLWALNRGPNRWMHIVQLRWCASQ
ncbi:hypothetical protein BH23PLA1_BH23PLA1_18990 [soil metagenome]